MPIPPQPPQACIFDLDGTLVDSLRDIAEALNECLDLLGLPTHPVDRYRYLVGEGMPVLCRRAVGDTHPHLVDRLLELMRPRYRTRPLRHTRPYRGVPELTARLRARGIRLGALSNKPHDMTVQVVQAYWPDGEFGAVYGYTDERLRKPDPTCALQICRELGTDPGATWLVGDTPTDIETARNGGLVGIGVTWGFRTREDLAAAGATWIVDRPEELDRA